MYCPQVGGKQHGKRRRRVSSQLRSDLRRRPSPYHSGRIIVSRKPKRKQNEPRRPHHTRAYFCKLYRTKSKCRPSKRGEASGIMTKKMSPPNSNHAKTARRVLSPFCQGKRRKSYRIANTRVLCCSRTPLRFVRGRYGKPAQGDEDGQACKLLSPSPNGRSGVFAK